MMDREKVIKGLGHCANGICNECPYIYECWTTECNPAARDALALLKEQEAVDAVPVVHGRWIIDTAFGNDVMSNGRMVLCSECGQGRFRGKTNYCPNCGAKMDGEQEG